MPTPPTGHSAGVHELIGPIQHYAWGDTEFLPKFLGLTADGQPWAEWWLGTHPSGPASLLNGRPLSDLCGPLPYLVKVLAAAQPLSLQVHPNAAQAALGHAAGRYLDPYPKPELIHALTEFEAFCGIRPVATTVELLTSHGIDLLAQHLVANGVTATMADILHGRIDVASVVAICTELAQTAPLHPSITWVAKLAQIHPGDPSVVATLLLHHVQLQPGEALRLEAGTLHGYLRGAGIEVMGPSDNVVRCGLTSKPIDIAGVLEILDSTEVQNPILPADAPHSLPELNIELRRLPTGHTHHSDRAQIAVTVDGRGFYIEPDAPYVMSVDSYLIGDAQATKGQITS
jgi:mannose-6-phosphate isomerase